MHPGPPARHRPRPGARPVRVAALTLLLGLLGADPAAGRPLDPGAPPAAGLSTVLPTGVWPLAPRPDVVAAFDAPAGPYAPGHRGVDLAGRPAQPVLSALPGRVRFAGAVAGRGVVVVEHVVPGGTLRTTYEPVVPVVAVGSQLAAGEMLGRLAVVGSHCFPAACLHWGLRRGETYLDPLTLLGADTAVRLLPLRREHPVDADAPAPPPVASGDPAHPYLAWPYPMWSPMLLAALTPWGGPGDRPGAAGRS